MVVIASLLKSKWWSHKGTILPLTFNLIPTITSSLFSSQTYCCRGLPLSPAPEAPPVAKQLPFTVSVHGKTWQDPYHWMRNTNDPDITHYLNQENSYAQAFMADTQDLQRTLSLEMKSRMPSSISTPPERWGPWLYYQYIPEEKEYPVLCRRLETGKNGLVKNLIKYIKGGFGREEVLLDWNKIAEQYGYVHIGTCRVSPDHKFLAYTLDTSGSERFMLQIKDLRDGHGHVLPGSQVDGIVSLSWAQDGSLFYTLSDDNQRPYRVMCKKLGSDESDVQVFMESNSSFCVDITSTKDGKFITVNSNSRTSSEVYLIDAANPLDGLRTIQKRVSGVQYFLEHHNGLFYILTNAPLAESKEWSGEDYYLVTSRVQDIDSANWKSTVLPGEDASIQDMDIFNGHLVLFLNKKGTPMLCSIDLPINFSCKHHVKLENLNPWYFPLPSSSCDVVPGSNHDFMNSTFRAVLSSPVMPDVIVDYNMVEKTFAIVDQEEVKGIIDIHHSDERVEVSEVQGWSNFSNTYHCESTEVVSHDGVNVPLTILYSRKAWQKGFAPGLLHGYGAYGEVLDKSWSADRLSLLDRGWIVAFADVRYSNNFPISSIAVGGGSDSSWHKSGSGLHKQNSIYDFVSCGRFLVSEGYVQEDRLCAIGFSAGGLLVGAAMNMYPSLFRAAILKVPFLDVCNTLLDPDLPLTKLDYEEFGNPQIQAQFECITSYSPYDNIPERSCFPSVLVTASFLDSRVGVWEAAKWVAKVRDITCHGCSWAVILKTNMTGGHFGEGGRYAKCDETAYDYAFLMKVIGSLKDKECINAIESRQDFH